MTATHVLDDREDLLVLRYGELGFRRGGGPPRGGGWKGGLLADCRDHVGGWRFLPAPEREPKLGHGPLVPDRLLATRLDPALHLRTEAGVERLDILGNPAEVLPDPRQLSIELGAGAPSIKVGPAGHDEQFVRSDDRPRGEGTPC